MNKQEKVQEFLASLGQVKKNNNSVDGFYIICKKCNSQNCIKYDNTGEGSEYTGAWGEAGIKCLDCGNAAEVLSF